MCELNAAACSFIWCIIASKMTLLVVYFYFALAPGLIKLIYWMKNRPKLSIHAKKWFHCTDTRDWVFPNNCYKGNRIHRNKARYTATEVACGWAGAIFEVTRPFWQKQWGQKNKTIKKSKMWPTGWLTDQLTNQWTEKMGCRVACMWLKILN